MHSHSVSGFLMLELLTYSMVISDRVVENKQTTSATNLTMTTKRICAEPLTSINESTALTILRDINNAFSVVTKNSDQIKQLIPTMFNLSLKNPAYIFRLPLRGGIDRAYLTMKKSDFVQPTFPNLTASYVRLMRSKDYNRDDGKHSSAPIEGEGDIGYGVSPNSDEDDPTVHLNLQTERSFMEYLNEVNQQDASTRKGNRNRNEAKHDEWSELGLSGWEGVLSKPGADDKKLFTDFYSDIEPDKDRTKTGAPQKWDLPGRTQDYSLESNILQAMKDSSILKIIENITQPKYPITNMRITHSDEDIYIARVNDPFGHSTKWNIKNSSTETQLDERKKRGVYELYSMIKCSTGCDPIIYKGYGCYCGFLGDGVPIDGIDSCCKLHDKCYEQSNCISYLEYFVPYIWKCYRGKPLCAIDHGEWGGPDSCAARLCHCDLSLSRCLRRFVCPRRRSVCRTSKVRMIQNLLFNI